VLSRALAPWPSPLSLHDALPILGRDEDGELRQPWSVILAAPNLTHAERLTSLLRGYGLKLDPPQRAAQAFGVAGDEPEGPSKARSEEHTSELQSRENLVCRLLLE